MVDQIPQHTHCQICRKAVAGTEPFCSDECKQQYDAMKKRNRLWIYIMYALMILIVVSLVFYQF
jgi:predicted nucleic acid-binding Zn ribbon protein